MEEKEYIKKLINQKRQVKINLKSGDFYTGIVLGMSETGILFFDKYNNEIYFSFDDVLRIVPTKNNGIRKEAS